MCRKMDDDVEDLPGKWKDKEIVTFEAAYRDPKLRQDIHRWVNKVKTDLRDKGFL